jgi:hypothetical protein
MEHRSINLTRALITDIAAALLLIGIASLLQIVTIHSLVLVFLGPIIVAFVRGFIQSYWVGAISRWKAAAEWIVILFSAYAASCWLDTLAWPYDTFHTVFAFGFVIGFVPAAGLGLIAYLLGIRLSSSKKIPRPQGSTDFWSLR